MRYRLPLSAGEVEIEAEEVWGGCAGGRPEYHLAGGFTVLAPKGEPLEHVKPPLPDEPPVGSVVVDRNGRVWQCRAGRPGSPKRWQSLLGGQEGWEYVATLDPVRLVPDPFAETVELPAWGVSVQRDRVIDGQRILDCDEARRKASALRAAADAAEKEQS